MIRTGTTSAPGILALGPIRLGMLENPYYEGKVREYLAGVEIVEIESFDEFFRGGGELDALVDAAEIASAWTLLHPEYSVAVPQPIPFRAPMAYPMARGDQELVNLVSEWIELKKRDGTIDALYCYWVLGREAALKRPRWSVIRDVLGWVE